MYAGVNCVCNVCGSAHSCGPVRGQWLVIYMNQFVMGPDEPVIPGQWLCFKLELRIICLASTRFLYIV